MNALLLILFLPIAATWNGFVLSKLWEWFIVPSLHAPSLRIPYAIGIALIVGWLTHKTRKTEDEPEAIHIIVMSLILPPLLLGYGWVVTLFI